MSELSYKEVKLVDKSHFSQQVWRVSMSTTGINVKIILDNVFKALTPSGYSLSVLSYLRFIHVILFVPGEF